MGHDINRDASARARAHLRRGKLYHERARRALPILVRQARITRRKQITYSELARELGMPNARNLNYVLGCIGETLQILGEAWNRIELLAVLSNARVILTPQHPCNL